MKSLRAVINEKLEKEGVHSISSYGLRFKGGDRLHVNDVCYARARVFASESDLLECAFSLKPALSFNRTAPRNHKNKWVDFILNRSIFKDVFITKNVQAAWRYGVQVDIEKPHSQVVAGMIAMREGWEFQNVLSNFIWLTKEGVDENLAFVISRMFGEEGGMMYREVYGGHQSIGAISKGNTILLLKVGMLVFGESFKESRKSYEIFKATRSGTDPVYNNLAHALMKGHDIKKGRFGNEALISKEKLLENIKTLEKEILS